MLAGGDLVAFVPTTDAGRARSFYEDTLGLELVETSEFACVFRTGASTLRVTLVEQRVDVPYTVLGWVVADLDTAMAELAARGVEPMRYEGLEQDERGAWSAPGGARVAWFRDPDGNTLSITQT